MIANINRFSEELAETRRLFSVQGIRGDESLLIEVSAALARMAPTYVAEAAQQRCGRSGENSA